MDHESSTNPVAWDVVIVVKLSVVSSGRLDYLNSTGLLSIG